MDENRVTFFAETDSRGKRERFGIKAKDRTKHIYVIGKTGMGKSTLLENMAIQDIQNGEGLTFIDPHGGSAEKLLDYVPKERIEDTLYVAPFDLDYPIGFNIMEDVEPARRHLVVAGLMSTFEKIWADAWSARMAYILQNTIHALLEYPGATLLDINRMYTIKEFRTKVVENITDPSVRSFWVDEYTKYTDRYTQEATPAIQNKVGQFASNPLIRNIVGQMKSTFDIRKMMDERKILIINLSKGRVGENNATLLGSMFVNKIYLAAMSRADAPASVQAKMPDFYLHVDEFQSFANKSFADILSEARKYRLSLTMAHQYIEQMEEEVRAAVFGNVGTTIAFRVGSFDAEVLEKEFAPVFFSEDIVNLGFAQIYLKLMIDGISSHPFSATTMPPIAAPAVSYKNEIIEHTRKTYGKSRTEVEKIIVDWQASFAAAPAEPRKPREGRTGENSHTSHREREEENGNRREPRKNSTVSQTPHPVVNSEAQPVAPARQPQRERPLSPLKQNRNVTFETRPPISLSELKRQSNKKNDKGPTEEGRASLRNAIASALQATKESAATEKNDSPQEGPEAGKAAEAKPVHEEKPLAERQKEKQQQEVPEDVLKKLLDVEGNG